MGPFFGEGSPLGVAAYTQSLRQEFITAKRPKLVLNSIPTGMSVEFMDSDMYVKYFDKRDKLHKYITYDIVQKTFGDRRYNQVPCEIQTNKETGEVTLLTADYIALRQNHSNPPLTVQSQLHNNDIVPAFEGIDPTIDKSNMWLVYSLRKYNALYRMRNQHFYNFKMGEFQSNLNKYKHVRCVGFNEVNELLGDDMILLGANLSKVFLSTEFKTNTGEALLTDKMISEKLGIKEQIDMQELIEVIVAKLTDFMLVLLPDGKPVSKQDLPNYYLSEEETQKLQYFKLSSYVMSMTGKYGSKITDSILEQIDIPIIQEA